MSISQLLEDAYAQNHLNLSPQIKTKILTFLDILVRWNKIHNLTALHLDHDLVWLHIMDSLSINSFLSGDRIIDIGTGAGLPGIPLSLLNPEKVFFLLDSNSKKTRFLKQVKLELGLSNVEIVHARCEKFNLPDRFDTIITRAFSSIAVMLRSTEHLLAPDGEWLAMKGQYPENELPEIPASYQVDIKPVEIHGLLVTRHLVQIRHKLKN